MWSRKGRTCEHPESLLTQQLAGHREGVLASRRLGAKKRKKPRFRLSCFPCKSRFGQPFAAYRCIFS
ncbi:UNVERIFIED_CONTAM: hypothetical protein HHA_270925 [Hammondia hammondi]|eukprot:XP_008882460.1 hypothetical protein HHA_270925 [Hammondia hammondi]